MKKSEIIRYNGIVFIFPLILILCDRYLFRISYSLPEVFGFFLLIIGGYIISMDGRTRRTVFSKMQWLFLSLAFVISASEYFLFKYYNDAMGINSISFYVSAWIFVLLFFVAGIFFRKRQGMLVATFREGGFFGKTLVSKIFDSLSGIFILNAVAMGTVSRVYSLESVSPLITFVLVFLLVKAFRVNMKELLSQHNMLIKLTGVVILSVGSYLIL